MTPTLATILGSLLSYALGSYITWRIMQRQAQAMQRRAEIMWLAQQSLWQDYKELLHRRTQP